MSRIVGFTLCTLLVFFIVLAPGLSASAYPAEVWGGHERPLPVRSLRDLRYEGVVGQSTWYTCGPAAVATLLTYYFSIPTTEEEALEHSLAAMEARGIPHTEGIPLLALRDALAIGGIWSEGFRVEPEALVDYFLRGGLPVILHVSRPQPHFVVAVAWLDGLLLVADPSFGRYWLPLRELVDVKGFDGYILVPIPDGDSAIRAHLNQSATVKAEEPRLLRLQPTLHREGWV